MRVSVVPGVAPAVLAMILSGCSRPAGSKPEATPAPAVQTPGDVVRAYTDAVTHGRVDEAWPLLSAKDRAFHSVEVMRRDAKALEEPNTRLVLAHTTSEIGATKIEGDSATVVQRVTSPDVDAIATRAQADPANAARMKAMSAEEAMAFGNKLLAEAVAKPDCPMRTSEESIKLAREEGAWKIVADFEGHARRERERMEHDPVVRDLQGIPPK